MSFLLLIFLSGFSQEINSTEKKIKIGLVLSGGGARGFAHIGVIKVLEEEGIDVDFIGGTSMGSIVGGLYAMGYSIESIEEIALSQNWEKILNDHIDREDMNFEEKAAESRHVFSMQLKNKKVSIPPGLVYGQNTLTLLSELTAPAFQSKDFNDLHKPFFCMATDLLSGKAIKLDTGNLAVAIRASMSVPSAFVPIEYGPYYLVDGGLINNMPAKHVRAMGADILIGVDIQTPLYKQDDIKNLVQVMSQSIFLNSESTFQENIADIDFLIKPDIDPYTSMDFDRADSLILRGERGARKMIPQIRAFMDSAGVIAVDAKREFNTFPDMDVLFIDKIIVEGNKRVTRELLLASLGLEDKNQVSVKSLNEKVKNLYGSKLFHTLTYQLLQSDNGETIIVIHVEEATTFHVNVGVHYNDYAKAGLLMNLTGRNLWLHNGRLSLDLALGSVSKISADYVLDHGMKPGFGVDVAAFWQRGFLYDEFGKRLLSFNMGVMQHHGYTLLSYENKHRFRLGYELESNVISQDVSVLEFEKIDDLSMAAFTDFVVDTYDNKITPKKGGYFLGRFALGRGRNTDIEADEKDEVIYLDKTFNYYVFDFYWSRAFSFGDHFVLQPRAYYRKNFGSDMPLTKMATFGGFTPTYLPSYRPFPGYEFMELAGHTAFYPELVIRHNFWTNNYISFIGRFLSLDFVLDKGFSANDFYYGWQVEYTYNSLIGPVSFSVAEAYPRKKIVFDFSLGFWF